MQTKKQKPSAIFRKKMKHAGDQPVLAMCGSKCELLKHMAVMLCDHVAVADTVMHDKYGTVRRCHVFG